MRLKPRAFPVAWSVYRRPHGAERHMQRCAAWCCARWPPGAFGWRGSGDLFVGCPEWAATSPLSRPHRHRLVRRLRTGNALTAVSGGSDRALILWDVDTGTQSARFKGQSAEVTSAAFSPDNKFLLTGGKDQGLHLWDAPTRRYLRAGRRGARPALRRGHWRGLVPMAAVRFQ